MRTRFLLLTAGLFAVGSLVVPADATAQDDLTKQLASIEQSLWKGWASADATPLRHHATASYVAIGDWGVLSGRDANIENASAGSCEVESYELDDWQVHRVADGTAILTYEAEQDATCEGTQVATEVMVSSVYVMEDGEWKAGSYHETPLADDGEDEDEDEKDDDDGEDDDGR